VPGSVFKETQFVKELKAPSSLLSEFHNKPMTVDAAVILPAEYFKELHRSFPVVFLVSGWGGDYHSPVFRGSPMDSIPCITVFLDGNCSLGHSVYANSDNNGPWGDALTKEFIPLLEKNFRCNGARFLRGHSSGGWTALYLQSHYPTVFAGCWSSSPDAVDFRDYYQVNLYKKENLLYDSAGNLRMEATVAGRFPWVSSKQAYQAERVIYRGEQMHSYDAVFSGRGADGNPERICDPFTGQVNEKVFEHWKNYDLSLYLRTNWDKLKKDLDGKIRVSVGEQDNFFLNGAVHLLDKEMKALNANMSFEYFPGDHFTVSTPEYREKALKFLAQKYAEWQKKNH
jgi:S-formylglutathione hydrolase FrmB